MRKIPGFLVKHAELMAPEEEKTLWEAKVIGTESPSALLNAVFFMNGKVLCLHGGREHRMLKLSQFTFGSDQLGEFVVYVENGSKNCSGSYKDKADSNKVIRHYSDPSLAEKCDVFILKLYFRKLDPSVFCEESSIFYYRALEKVRDDKAWFTKQPVGRNALATMV